jgi:hypothetical protein
VHVLKEEKREEFCFREREREGEREREDVPRAHS